MENLRAEAKSLHEKLKLISSEISGKEKEIESLRHANSKLIEANLEKVRKPKSLEIQRNQIVKIDVEILELKLVEKSLNEKLTQADAAIRKEKLKEQINGFCELSKSQLQDIEMVRRNITALEKSLIQLETVSGKNGAVYNLLQILFNNPEAKELVDLKEVLQNWSVSNINLALPIELETRLSQFNNQIFGLHNQLHAIHTNSRTYPTSKLPKAKSSQTIPSDNFVRTKMAAQDALQRGKENKRRPVIQHFRQESAPPG